MIYPTAHDILSSSSPTIDFGTMPPHFGDDVPPDFGDDVVGDGLDPVPEEIDDALDEYDNGDDVIPDGNIDAFRILDNQEDFTGEPPGTVEVVGDGLDPLPDLEDEDPDADDVIDPGDEDAFRVLSQDVDLPGEIEIGAGHRQAGVDVIPPDVAFDLAVAAYSLPTPEDEEVPSALEELDAEPLETSYGSGEPDFGTDSMDLGTGDDLLGDGLDPLPEVPDEDEEEVDDVIDPGDPDAFRVLEDEIDDGFDYSAPLDGDLPGPMEIFGEEQFSDGDGGAYDSANPEIEDDVPGDFDDDSADLEIDEDVPGSFQVGDGGVPADLAFDIAMAGRELPSRAEFEPEDDYATDDDEFTVGDDVGPASPGFAAFDAERVAASLPMIQEVTEKLVDREWTLDFGPAWAPAGATTTITISPQVAFRGEKIIATDNSANPGRGTRVLSVAVGQKVQSPNGGAGTLTMFFAETALGNGVKFDTANGWTQISMTVSFIETCTFDCTIWGSAAVPL